MILKRRIFFNYNSNIISNEKKVNDFILLVAGVINTFKVCDMTYHPALTNQPLKKLNFIIKYYRNSSYWGGCNTYTYLYN